VASANYQLKVITVAGYEVKWADGKSIFDGYGSDPNAAPTAAQTAEEVAAWCAKSGTVAFTVSKEGYAKQASVDFGGNDGGSSDADNGLGSYLCAKIMELLGYKEFNC
jgi:ABC-type transport system substrate-binding protein